MRCYFFFSAFFCAIVSLHAQNIQLINSGKVIEDANVAYDSGDYASAIKVLQTIHQADTNYVFMLSELADAYNADGQHDKALEIADQGLKNPSEYRPTFLRIQAQAFDKKGDLQKSVELFNKAIGEYPTSTMFWYFLGITYFNNKVYDKAIDCFFKVLSINPYHGGSHLNLGKLAILQGRKVHGMFSLGIYLGVNSRDNGSLVLLDNFLDNEVTDEGTIAPVGTNAAEKLDRVIKARIAMEKDFKSSIPITAAVVKQYELMLDQLGTLPESPDDKWFAFYLPSYRAIRESQLEEPFIYHMLSSSTIEAAKKWRSKNEDALKKYYSSVSAELGKHRAFQTLPSYGFAKPVQAWYGNNNVMEALGAKEGDVRQGKWIYLHPNQTRKAEGSYDKTGKKIGVWKYYHSDGLLKSEENYDTGKAIVYYDARSPKEEFSLKDDKIDGEVVLYHECGSVRERLLYKGGVRAGKGESYYISGKIQNKYFHDNNLLQGEYTSYYENGGIESKRIYDKGYYNGKYLEFYENGKPQSEGEYAAGVVVGKWTFYHDNGKIARTGTYSSKGIPQNEWQYFDEDGQLVESRKFNNDGELNGENVFYDRGKRHYVLNYRNGVMTKCTYYDKSDKVIGTFGSNNGDFAVKHFYNSGQVSSEGAYKKGKPEGLWKYYDRYGNRTSTYEYKEGSLNGRHESFYATGETKLVCVYQGDELHGYFTEYFRNGKIKQEGWYQDGMRQQRWLGYHSNGDVESEYYYLNDKTVGQGNSYGVDGKITSKFEYKDDKIINITFLNPEGGERMVRTPVAGGFSVASLFPNKKIRIKYEVKCGAFSGEFLSQTPEGKPFIRYSFSERGRHGNYEFNNVDGTKDVTGQYTNGLRSGTWRIYYEDGKINYEGRYRSDKQDSVWTFYFPNGKISSTSSFKNGLRQGVSQYFTPDGDLILEKLFLDDDMIAYRPILAGKAQEWINFTGNEKIEVKNAGGQTVWEQEFKNGERHGVFKLYFSNGKIHEIENYHHGERNGEYLSYFSNGKVAERGNYSNDELEGVFQYYNADGTLRKMETFHMGTQHGKTVLYAGGKPVKELVLWNGYIE